MLNSAVFFVLWIPIIHSATVLFFLIGTDSYERHIFSFLAQQLALRNHDVITVKPILIPEEPRLVKPRLHMVREKQLKNLLPKDLYSPLETVGSEIPWSSEYEIDGFAEPYWRAHNYSCEKMLNSNLMSSLKKDNIEVAVVYSGNPCQLAIVHSLGIPFIYFDVEGFTDETVIASGTPWDFDLPSSRSAPQLSAISPFYNGLQLIRESVCQSASSFMLNSLKLKLICKRTAALDEPISQMFIEDYEVKKQFASFPKIDWIKQNADLYFVNTDPLIESTRSFPAHVMAVGGVHIDEPRPLFSPWNSSIQSAELGTILIQMGSMVDSSAMPESLAKAFVGALSRLTKYRIYWRIGTKLSLKGVDLDSLPTHINVTTFFPQNDLLAHKRTKLLITNGGMSSVMEAIANGVPLLGIPLYGCNYQNLLKVQRKGFGLILPKSNITERTLYSAIRKILDSPRFGKNAAEISYGFRSRPGSVFERAVYGIEAVASGFTDSPKRRPKGFRLILETTNLHFFGLLLLSTFASAFLAAVVFIFIFDRTLSKRPSFKESKTNVNQNKSKQ